MATEEVTITKPIKSRRWGWGYETTPTGEDAHSIKEPKRPDYRGTPRSLKRAQENDRTYQSFLSGGTYTNEAWFYEGKKVEQIQIADEYWTDPERYWDSCRLENPPKEIRVRIKA